MCNCSHGPVSTMPGSIHKVPSGQTCDKHTDRMATFRVQGETDSFGAEYVDMCDECKAEFQAAKEELNPGYCQWCGKHADDRKPTRDYDEGMSGPVYDVCQPCRQAASDRAHAELEEMRAECPILDNLDDWDDEPHINVDDTESLAINQSL